LFNDSAAQTFFAVVKDNRLTGRDGALRHIKGYSQTHIEQSDGATLIRLTVSGFGI
jgi:hypothetical protein